MCTGIARGRIVMGMKARIALLTAGTAGLAFYTLAPVRAQQAIPGESEPQVRPVAVVESDSGEARIAEADCPFFGDQRERFLPRIRNLESAAGRITRQFYATGGSRDLARAAAEGGGAQG